MFPSISSLRMNPMIQNDLNLYYHKSSSPHYSQYSSSKIPSPPASPPPSPLPPPSMFPPLPPRESQSPLRSPSSTPSLPPLPPPTSPPLSLPNIFENSTEDNETGSNYTGNSYYNSSIVSNYDLQEVRKSVDTKVNLLSTIVSTFSNEDISNVSFGDDSDSPDGDCDIYDGEWVRDVDREPYYPPGSCLYIEKQPFDCYFSGKRDNEYLNWQW
ncbi:hypothetical protein MKX01_038952 [Papaver californicum]|nr:hypothetical protein MKX01_038952 [Papaver californicum]